MQYVLVVRCCGLLELDVAMVSVVGPPTFIGGWTTKIHSLVQSLVWLSFFLCSSYHTDPALHAVAFLVAFAGRRFYVIATA